MKLELGHLARHVPSDGAQPCNVFFGRCRWVGVRAHPVTLTVSSRPSRLT